MRFFLSIVLPALLLAACGQKGALYLPTQVPVGKRHHISLPPAQPATAGSAANMAASGTPAPLITPPQPSAASGASTGTP